MEDKTVDQIASAFRKVLSEGEAGDESNRAILIKRIPIICNDILEIKNALLTLKTNQEWIKWLVMGGVAGICGLAVILLTK